MADTEAIIAGVFLILGSIATFGLNQMLQTKWNARQQWYEMAVKDLGHLYNELRCFANMIVGFDAKLI